MVNQFGNLFAGRMNNALNIISFIFALVILGFMIYMLFFRRYNEATKLSADVNIRKE